MGIRIQRFFLVSFTLHLALFALYQFGCPRAVVHSEPLGVSVQVLSQAHLSVAQEIAPRKSLPITKNAPATSVRGNSLGNTETEAGAKEGVEAGAASGLEASAKERYLYELRLLLDSRKQYPSLAKTLRQEGLVEVGFLVRPDGQIAETGIVKPSSHSSLNKAALQLVEAVGKFKPLPAELKKALGWRVSVPIEYRLQ
ncbi:MAG: energy transducer TonB [Bacteriovoracia bacterium]